MYKIIDNEGKTLFKILSDEILADRGNCTKRKCALTTIFDDVDCDELIKTAFDAMENIKNQKIAAMCSITGLKIGEPNDYVSTIFSVKDVIDLNLGDSVFLTAPTGSGKSEAIERISMKLLKDRKIKILTNRKVNSIQLHKEFKEKFGLKDLPDDLLEKVLMHPNLEIMTYQKFILHSHKYNNEQFLLILDECHCLVEDSSFSLYGQKMFQFLYNNLDNTTRVYITATPDDIINIIWKMEAISENDIAGINEETRLLALVDNKRNFKTRIKHFYMMKSNWDYITFKSYNPNDRDGLAKYINDKLEKNNKAFIFINDKDKGKELKELLPSCQHIYSSEDKIEEISQLAFESRFECDTLIATKVAENGLSLHDEQLNIVVAESWEPLTIQQVIGRARVGRKNPREIEVLIPDYSISELGTIEWQIISQLNEFEKAMSDPDYVMQYIPQPNPYIYYSAIKKKPVVNEVGYNTLRNQLSYIQELKNETCEDPHAFLRRILDLYDKNTDITDELYINYDQLSDFKSRIKKAWEEYKSSLKNENNVAELKENLKSACNETNAYGKVFKSNIQLQTVNEILKFAGIKESIASERKVFDVITDNDMANQL